MKQYQLNAKKTATPELPVLVQSWSAPDPIALERAVHGILKYRQKSVANGAGTEWFKTTTDEIFQIIDFAKG